MNPEQVVGKSEVNHRAVITYHHRNEDGDASDAVRTDESPECFVEPRRDDVRRSVFGRR